MTTSRKTNTKQTVKKKADWRTGEKFNRDELIALSLEAIDKHNLMFISEIYCYLDCSKSTFYNYHLERLDSIKDALANNRTRRKVELRQKWYQSDNPITQIALYKLIGTTDELDRLSNARQRQEVSNEKPLRVTFQLDSNRANDIQRKKLFTTGEPVDDSAVDGELLDDSGD